MSTSMSRDGPSPRKGRPGPKPRGRTVVPLTITVTHTQRAALEARADAQQCSISTIVRQFVAAGLAAGGLLGLMGITTVHRIGRIRSSCPIARPRGLPHLAQRATPDAAAAGENTVVRTQATSVRGRSTNEGRFTSFRTPSHKEVGSR
jgi:hypothetical protein